MAKLGLFAVCVLCLVLFTTLQTGEALNAVNVTGTEGKHLGKGNYADVKIRYAGTSTLTISNALLKWGIWVPGNGDYHKEIESPNGMSMAGWGEYHIATASRWNLPSGTEASVDIYKGSERVLYLYWHVSFGGSALWQHKEFSKNFMVEYTPIDDSNFQLTVVIKELGGVEAS